MRAYGYLLKGLIFLQILFFILLPGKLSAQRQLEKLDRGILAVKVNDGVFVSWRVLGTEWRGTAYNLYRGSEKLNTSPITGPSHFLDLAGTIDSYYHVRAVTGSVEQESSDTVGVWEKRWFDLPVRDIPGDYGLNDASVGDLDGDGDYEIVVKRISPDMTAEPDYTHLLEAYHLDGTHIWTIDYGPNRLGPQQVNFIVYDLDGDGKAEVVTKTSEGTIDGTGVEIGDTDGDGITNYRSTAVNDDIIEGPEFLSIYDGMTGEEIARTDYIARDPLSQWGLPGHDIGQLAHRADAVMMAIIYADGRTPTLVICRGIYHRTKMIAMNYRGGELTELWRFDSHDWPEGFRGQGNHNLSVADVDDDGRDEIVYGSMTVDHDGSGLYGTGLGHGDAMHVSDMDPDRPGLEVWQAHESSPAWGGTYRDAATGEILIHYISGSDMGRACAGDISPDHRGFEMWGSTGCPIYNSDGDVLGPTNVPINFMIWWDGDLLREFLDHNWLGNPPGTGIGTISKYDGNDDVNLLTATGTYSTNYTKGNPCLSADILGDWREEVIWRTSDDRNLRIFTTTIPTTHRIYTLMHDPQYRLAIAWQNNAYNQPPHPGFYLGDGMDSLPPPPVSEGRLVWNSGEQWDEDLTSAWLRDGVTSTFLDGDEVLFGITGETNDSVILAGQLAPFSVTVYSPDTFNFTGAGGITGTTGLVKAGSGLLDIHTENDFTGHTSVWNGTLRVSGSLSGSYLNIKRFAALSGKGTLGKDVTIETFGSIMPGKRNTADTLSISGHLRELGDVSNYFDLSGDSSGTVEKNDLIMVGGDLTLEGNNTMHINLLGDSVQRGTYTLIRYGGTFTGNIENIDVTGIPDVPWELIDNGSAIQIRFLRVREPGLLVWKGGVPNEWDVVNSRNWLNQGQADWFVPGDTVLFTDEGIPNSEVVLEGSLLAGEVRIDASGDYTFRGSGSITGEGGLLKNGTGSLFIRNMNDYTGPTHINQGTIDIAALEKAGYASPLGAAGTGADRLVLDGGSLRINSSSTSDRSITLGSAGGTLNLPNPGTYLRLDGTLAGPGQLVKKGIGTLTFNTANDHQGGTLISRGTIHLGTESANIGGPGTGPLTIENGTLSMLDNRHSYTDNCNWDLIVPNGGYARLFLDSRCSLTGSLSGSGTLEVHTPFIRSELAGDWSAFQGEINVRTSADGASFLIGNPAGYPGASVHLGDHVTALYQHTANVTIGIGSLEGTPASRLGAGGSGSATITWKVGSLNTNAEFHGVICNDQFKESGAKAAVIKTGNGTWTLTNENTYTGPTVVEGGLLRINNISVSGTGTGTVTVKSNAALDGAGIIAGPLTVEANGLLTPGSDAGRILTLNSGATLMPGSYLGVEVDPADKSANMLRVNGILSMKGYLYFTNSGSVSFTAGDSLHIIDCQDHSGNLAGILPASPGAGLRWDTTAWTSAGIIVVEQVSSTSDPKAAPAVRIFPNPASGQLTIMISEVQPWIGIRVENLNGQTLIVSEVSYTDEVNLDLQRLEPGWYIFKLETVDGLITRQFIKHL
jgi:autotransporter-associated beta strand protein